MSDHDDIARLQVWLWMLAFVAMATAARGCSTSQRVHDLEERLARWEAAP